jgi:hypothetical protein
MKVIVDWFERIIAKICYKIYNFGTVPLNEILFNIRCYFYENTTKNKSCKRMRMSKFHSKMYDLFTALDYDILSKFFDKCFYVYINIVYKDS